MHGVRGTRLGRGGIRSQLQASRGCTCNNRRDGSQSGGGARCTASGEYCQPWHTGTIGLHADGPLTRLALVLAFLLVVLAVSAWRSSRKRGVQAEREELPRNDEESEYRSL